MKKNFLLLVIMVLFSACGSDNNTKNLEEGYKFLSSLNVSDAKVIYKKIPSSRAISETDSLNTFYKIDMSGNEVKLSIKGIDGIDHNIGIVEIYKLSDNYIIICPNYIEILKSLGYDEVYDGFEGLHVGAYAMLVNLKTEKMYKWPSKFVPFDRECLRARTDKEGNVYFSPGGCLVKFNVKDYTLDELTDEGQNYSNFELTENGFIAYKDERRPNTYKIKCPGGRIYPVNGFWFMTGKKFYTYRDDKIYNLATDGTNSIKEVEICELKFPSPSNTFKLERSLNNPLKGTTLLQGNFGKCYEFDGESCQEINNIPGDFFGYNPRREEIVATSQAWYRNSSDNPNDLEKMSMKDYTLTTISLSDYEVQHKLSNSQSPDVLFSGISYLNGDRVLGKITGDDEIIIESTTKKENDFIQLIPIN